MKFIIKSLRKNIYTNIIIILLFLLSFINTNYNDIQRYMDGFKYPSSTTTISITFRILPNEKSLEYRATTLLEKMRKEYFFINCDESINKVCVNVISKHQYKIPNDRYSLFGFNIIFDTDRFLKIERKMRKFIDLYMNEFKKNISENFDTDNSIIFLNDTFYKIIKKRKFVSKIYPFMNKLNKYDDYIVFELSSFYVYEDLKLGQTKKILLSKLIISNLLFCIATAILCCLIISIIRIDISKRIN